MAVSVAPSGWQPCRVRSRRSLWPPERSGGRAGMPAGQALAGPGRQHPSPRPPRRRSAGRKARRHPACSEGIRRAAREASGQRREGMTDVSGDGPFRLQTAAAEFARTDVTRIMRRVIAEMRNPACSRGPWRRGGASPPGRVLRRSMSHVRPTANHARTGATPARAVPRAAATGPLPPLGRSSTPPSCGWAAPTACWPG